MLRVVYVLAPRNMIKRNSIRIHFIDSILFSWLVFVFNSEMFFLRFLILDFLSLSKFKDLNLIRKGNIFVWQNRCQLFDRVYWKSIFFLASLWYLCCNSICVIYLWIWYSVTFWVVAFFDYIQYNIINLLIFVSIKFWNAFQCIQWWQWRVVIVQNSIYLSAFAWTNMKYRNGIRPITKILNVLEYDRHWNPCSGDYLSIDHHTRSHKIIKVWDFHIFYFLHKHIKDERFQRQNDEMLDNHLTYDHMKHLQIFNCVHVCVCASSMWNKIVRNLHILRSFHTDGRVLHSQKLTCI